MEVNQIIGIIIIGFLGIYLIINQLRLLFNRYLRTYNKEINKFLNEGNLKLVETTYPNNLDWEKSPFNRPAKVEISFLIITLNGAVISWNQKSYKIIIAESGKGKHKLFWLEINTTYFRKPILTFREGSLRNDTSDNLKKQKVKVIKVKENCPACGYKLSKDDIVCPDCGIHFN